MLCCAWTVPKRPHQMIDLLAWPGSLVGTVVEVIALIRHPGAAPWVFT
jgi:hypothetical protein